MKFDLVIKNGTIVSHVGRYQANIGVKDGKISSIFSDMTDVSFTDEIDAKGKYILPGLIDAHVHFEDPGRPDREDFAHGTAGCAVGGITTPIIMPTNDPLILSKEALQVNLDSWADKGYVDYAVHGGVAIDSFETVEELWTDTGVCAIKAFMCYSSPNMGFVNDEVLFETLEALSKYDGMMIIHAENDGLINLYTRREHEKNVGDYGSFNRSRPDFGEVEAVRRAIFFVERTGGSALFPHIATAEALKEIKAAQNRGVKVYAEATPQHYTFNNKDFDEKGPYLKFTPVMYEQENMDEMWKLMKNGYVDTIGSDHSPYAKWEKEAGMEDIWESPNGIPGVETLLPTFLNAVNEGKIALEDVVRMTSLNPSKIFGLEGKGQIVVGNDADITIVDMDLSKEYTDENIQSVCRWSPYFDMNFKGWPIYTIVRGCVVSKDGKLVGKQGFGKLISRKK